MKTYAYKHLKVCFFLIRDKYFFLLYLFINYINRICISKFILCGVLVCEDQDTVKKKKRKPNIQSMILKDA
jgi:hypothetical protein